MMSRIIFLIFSLIVGVGCKKVISNDRKKDIKDTIFVEQDSFLLKKYHVDTNKIVEEISSNRDNLYHINVYVNQDTIKYNLSDNIYESIHQQIVWRSKDYIFVRTGCGSPCWNGSLLNLNKKETKIYPFYYFLDKNSQVIVYPDENDSNVLVLENFKINTKKTFKLDTCEKVLHPLFSIDTIYKFNKNSIHLEYLDTSCESKKQITILY